MQPGKIKIKEIRNYEAKNDINGKAALYQAPLQTNTFEILQQRKFCPQQPEIRLDGFKLDC